MMSVRLVGGASDDDAEEHSDVRWCMAARLKLGILAGMLVEVGREAASWERTTLGEKLETVGKGEDVVGNLKITKIRTNLYN